ncbi:asparagine synthase (glutamine-hydrolyzing) [Flammeovirga yaeyamensis]|uniref:asparagine synthase (glutamine-hydrolyzing) n=1 Tax=Flammeovirga yaeyamensis TaxID=367791 RepID=A0AAX1N4M2_9BACT|nr:asparagine synthase (glutamine-hydrolyzing) [Flammeovirga yaeyamensis]MBB3698538.1 asparagine synthase (glutamine-hydrolyzing) [Flammeovirga yaeyamensis]NMF34113.1 asparagine synthase (glutamine-hydrolyzing) [Flammeovirga yaeyamensis]QWG01100.1 asparagine synthase (glutamine-hydrolyzing) [Flammeovirga yaeyamensis]
MCGITGLFAFNEIGRMQAIHMHRANDQLAHRGPDAADVFSSHFVHLGHRRLSIIDLTEGGNQPMSDPSGRYTIVFNGEIYNYKTIKSSLEQRGVVFKTTSDTEVLLHAYIHFGTKVFEQLHGFFAFAIYDNDNDSLIIARDRLGIKPLLYSYDEDKIVFGSEMNALLQFGLDKEVDFTSVFQLLQLTYISSPNSIFKSVKKLPQGCYMMIKDKKFTIQRYYDLALQTEKNLTLNYEEAKAELLKIFDHSVQERMVSDVPLGSFLSGGIDSSAVVAMASKYTDQLQTFSIGYKDEPLFDETHYAELVAKKYNTQHTAFKLTQDDFYNHLFGMLDHYGEPFADASAIAVNILSKETRKHVTVALSGDGADEIFAGYNKHYGEWRTRKGGSTANMIKNLLPILNKLPQSRNSAFGNKVRQAVKFGEGMKLSPKERYWFQCCWRDTQSALDMLHPSFKEELNMVDFNERKNEITQFITGDGFSDVLYSDINGLLVNDMLHKVDSMSMYNSLEVRVPFLDHKVVEFGMSLPSEYKIDGKMKKKILQDAFRPLLPEELYKRPKHGFEVPLMKGYKTALRTWVNEMLDRDFVEHQKIFDPNYTERLKKTIFETENYDQNQVWSILVLQHWWKKYKVE